MTVDKAQQEKESLPGIPDQRTLALLNMYIANTTKTLNQLAAVCERKVHDVDRRCGLHKQLAFLDVYHCCRFGPVSARLKQICCPTSKSSCYTYHVYHVYHIM